MAFGISISIPLDTFLSPDYDPELVQAATATNEKQRAAELAKQTLGSLKGKGIAFLRLAFKPNMDDMRGVNNVTQRLTLDDCSP